MIINTLIVYHHWTYDFGDMLPKVTAAFRSRLPREQVMGRLDSEIKWQNY
jgi:hypothetical protein